ncbi:hypothetical protein COO60DRAFT_1657890 [Scenedesmus sp. NREL 46B-D3]|nr:hypothetical protein COO60DRAFT_1657890 [Scenedesmus sp. NREL 46B-D3]
MATVPRSFHFLLLTLLALAMHSAAARVTINMTAAAEAAMASNAGLAAPAATTHNSLQEVLAQLLSPNGTHKINVTIPKLPILQPRNVTVPKLLQDANKLSFNFTLPELPNLSSAVASGSNSSAAKKDTLKMATDVLQQLTQLQPSLAKLDALFKNLNTNAGTSTVGRSLLEDADAAATDETTIHPAATGRSLSADDNTIGVAGSNTTGKNASEVFNSRKIAQKVNLAMSDGWLVLFSGFRIAQASVQLLAALLRAGSTGVVSVDPALLLTFADLGTNFSSAVSYLMYSLQKSVADVVTPFGIHKPAKG